MTKRKLWVAEITCDDCEPMHEDGEIQAFETPEDALYEGQHMQGVEYDNMSFIVRRLAEYDIPTEVENSTTYRDIALLTSRDDPEWSYPAYIGHNGADWVRMQYMHILFAVLGPEQPNKALLLAAARQLPAADPNKEKLLELLEAYLAKND